MFAQFNQIFTLFCVFPFMILFGLYLTIQLKGVQFTKLTESFKQLIKRKSECEGHISHFEALATVLAGNFGTGNISGMAVALTTGGPGALVWMWVMALFGAVIQYASCFLGVKYRTQNEAKEFVGGPMYYLSKGLGYKKCAALFALLTIFGAITVGNFAQMNSMSLPIKSMGLSPLFFGIILAVCVGLVLIGGVERLARFSSVVVPFKAFAYLGTGLFILFLNGDQLIPTFKLMFESAIHPSAFAGGLLGSGLAHVISTGFDRGLFATDAGTGIVPILQSSARTHHPVIDGLVTLVAPLMVMVVCTMTGLVLIVTGAWLQPGLESTNMVTYAFKTGMQSDIGEWIVIIALLLFGYTTILAWATCAERAVGYLWNVQKAKLFRYLYIALVPVGAFLQVDLVWTLADICITLMLMINLIGIMGLSGEVIKETVVYYGKMREVIT